MVTRSLMLPLLAVAATTLAGSGVCGPVDSQVQISKGVGPNDARLSFAHVIAGAGKVDLIADGRTLKRNLRYGKILKAKSLRAEGYSIDVDASKVGLPYIDAFTADLVGGRDYTLIAYGDTDSTTPSAPLLVDLPGLQIPKTTTQLVFANASHDSPPAELLVDEQSFFSNVGSGSFQGPVAIDEGKHRIEVKIGGITVINSSVENLKGGETATFVLYGTAASSDGKPLELLEIDTKSR